MVGNNQIERLKKQVAEERKKGIMAAHEQTMRILKLKEENAELKKVIRNHDKMNKDFKRCPLCEKEGKIIHEGWRFCSKEHVKLFDQKWNETQKEMKKIKTCSICGKPIGKSKWNMTDCNVKRVTDDFKVYRFCSQRCWDEWE
jgi:hypothetical protein